MGKRIRIKMGKFLEQWRKAIGQHLLHEETKSETLQKYFKKTNKHWKTEYRKLKNVGKGVQLPSLSYDWLPEHPKQYFDCRIKGNEWQRPDMNGAPMRAFLECISKQSHVLTSTHGRPIRYYKNPMNDKDGEDNKLEYFLVINDNFIIRQRAYSALNDIKKRRARNRAISAAAKLKESDITPDANKIREAARDKEGNLYQYDHLVEIIKPSKDYNIVTANIIDNLDSGDPKDYGNVSITNENLRTHKASQELHRRWPKLLSYKNWEQFPSRIDFYFAALDKMRKDDPVYNLKSFNFKTMEELEMFSMFYKAGGHSGGEGVKLAYCLNAQLSNRIEQVANQNKEAMERIGVHENTIAKNHSIAEHWNQTNESAISMMLSIGAVLATKCAPAETAKEILDAMNMPDNITATDIQNNVIAYKEKVTRELSGQIPVRKTFTELSIGHGKSSIDNKIKITNIKEDANGKCVNQSYGVNQYHVDRWGLTPTAASIANQQRIANADAFQMSPTYLVCGGVLSP